MKHDISYHGYDGDRIVAYGDGMSVWIVAEDGPPPTRRTHTALFPSPAQAKQIIAVLTPYAEAPDAK